jgi:Zn-dependent protease with chaperone function
MFAIRGIVISLASFWLSYCSLSLLVVSSSQFLYRLRRLPPRLFATLQFIARMLPLALSALATLVFAAPSFLLFEPRGMEEGIGVVPIVLSACCLAFFVVGLIRVIGAQTSTTRVVSRWLRGARTLDIGVIRPVFQVAGTVPPLLLAGVRRHRLLVSESALSLLSPDELKTAVRHEIAHMRSQDNLKKLAVRFAWFPLMGELEKAWRQTAELAADDAAVSNATEALDLAAALIKLARQVRHQPLPIITMALVHDAFIEVRVSRLVNWEQTGLRSTGKSWCFLTSGVFAILLATAAAYGPLLHQTHAITEWLVR